MTPKIRFIVTTICNPNSERFARVTSTITGRTLSVVNVGGEQNIPSTVNEALRHVGLGHYRGINSTAIDLPHRRWKGAYPTEAITEGELTAEMILGLEQIQPEKIIT